MSATQATDSRPHLVHVSRSFSRMEPSNVVPESPRKRATTLAGAGIPAIPEAKHLPTSPELAGKQNDVFESHEEEEHDAPGVETPGLQLPSTFDELPIEIRSLTERFLEGLSAKVHPTPLTADALSDMFQDFYVRAESQIATHIASLASRIGREKAPVPAASSKASLKGRARSGSGAKRGGSPASNSGGEMLTASEVTDRKKQRRLLELKRTALEEAVERGVCEKVYDRLFKHKSTDDDARDEKLRSRTAALSLVGIGLKELHMDSDPAKENVRKTAEEKEDDIHQSLASAREALQRMDNEHYPLGKLQHLTTAHKCIVDTLAELFPSSSSADEILPTLIYTLITSPPEGINVISNLNFVQRFRAQSKVDGEAAYCLVNLEAAISFVETVDLSSLRPEELPQGPPKSSSRPTTPIVEKNSFLSAKSAEARSLSPAVSSVTSNASELSSSSQSASRSLPSPTATTGSSTSGPRRPSMHNRRLSSLVQSQADRLEAGRQDFLSTADKAFDTINSTLDNSLSFVFGRFKERVPDSSPLPKTLEEARKLVNTSAIEEEDALSTSGRSSPGFADDPLNASGKATDNKMLDLIGGSRKQLRDRSVDSSRSAGSGSGRRVTFANNGSTATEPSKEKLNNKEEPLAAATNFINSMNPLNRFGVPGFARFGRQPGQPSPIQASPIGEKGKQLGSEIVESPATMRDPKQELVLPLSLKKETSHSSMEDDRLNAAEALAELRSIKPPSRRFLEVKDAGELRVGEVEDLLQEYRRLAKAIADAIAT